MAASRFRKNVWEFFSGGAVLQLDNFRSLKGFGWPGFSKQSSWRQDKGQLECASTFVRAVETGNDEQLIPLDELFEVMDSCLTVVSQIGFAKPG